MAPPNIPGWFPMEPRVQDMMAPVMFIDNGENQNHTNSSTRLAPPAMTSENSGNVDGQNISDPALQMAQPQPRSRTALSASFLWVMHDTIAFSFPFRRFARKWQCDVLHIDDVFAAVVSKPLFDVMEKRNPRILRAGNEFTPVFDKSVKEAIERYSDKHKNAERSESERKPLSTSFLIDMHTTMVKRLRPHATILAKKYGYSASVVDIALGAIISTPLFDVSDKGKVRIAEAGRTLMGEYHREQKIIVQKYRQWDKELQELTKAKGKRKAEDADPEQQPTKRAKN